MGLSPACRNASVKNAKDFAQRAFDIADAMLEESDRRGVQQEKGLRPQPLRGTQKIAP